MPLLYGTDICKCCYQILPEGTHIIQIKIFLGANLLEKRKPIEQFLNI